MSSEREPRMIVDHGTVQEIADREIGLHRTPGHECVAPIAHAIVATLDAARQPDPALAGLREAITAMDRNYGSELIAAYPFGWEMVRRAAGLPPDIGGRAALAAAPAPTAPPSPEQRWTRFTSEVNPEAEALMEAADEGRIDWEAE